MKRATEADVAPLTSSSVASKNSSVASFVLTNNRHRPRDLGCCATLLGYAFCLAMLVPDAATRSGNAKSSKNADSASQGSNFVTNSVVAD
jgi:hypothetical protein